jgi:hypothetical protein
MKLYATLRVAVLATMVGSTFGSTGATLEAADIKRLAIADAHTAVYAKANPEREYQTAYLADAWKTFRDERIAERIFEIVAARAPEDELAKFKDAWEEIETALEPVNLAALSNAQEFMMFNAMVGPFGQTVVAVRLSEDDAEDYREGVGNLFELVEEWAGEKITVETSEQSGAEITLLRVPEESPYQPAIASIDDLFLISTSEEMLKLSLAQLDDEDKPSKFDDERFKESLTHLPEAEDAVTFFDADKLFEGMANMGDFIRRESDNEDAERIAKVFEKTIDQFNFLEYETAVEYTEDGQNRSAAMGQWSENFNETLVGRAISKGQPFDKWQSWVPEDASAYSMSTGIYLHEIYSGVLEFVRSEFPEAKEPLDEWDALQERVGVNLDEDILQSFTGENVSVTFADGQEVVALRCTNESKIRGLLDRAIEGLQQIPQIAAQEIDLVESDDAALEGFQELKAGLLAMTPAKPVIGFRDGWMFIATSPDAAKRILAVRAGDAPSIAGAESLKRFDLKVDGEVSAVSYTDVGAGVRAFADAIDQVAAVAPLALAAPMADASTEDRKMVSDILGLMPSIAKVIRKFDFFEQRLSITREGPVEGTYLREGVQLIRQPADDDSA